MRDNQTGESQGLCIKLAGWFAAWDQNDIMEGRGTSMSWASTCLGGGAVSMGGAGRGLGVDQQRRTIVIPLCLRLLYFAGAGVGIQPWVHTAGC